MSDSNDSTVPNTFQRIPGQGFLFFKSLHADPANKTEAKIVAKYAAANKTDRNLDPLPPSTKVKRIAIWRGYVTLPGDRSVDLRVQANGRAGHYIMTAHAFLDDKLKAEAWTVIGDGTVPLLGESSYSDGVLTVDGKPYKLRIIRSPEGYLRVRLPQVLTAKHAAAAQM